MWIWIEKHFTTKRLILRLRKGIAKSIDTFFFLSLTVVNREVASVKCFAFGL